MPEGRHRLLGGGEQDEAEHDEDEEPGGQADPAEGLVGEAGPAVERPFQRADRPRHRGDHVRSGRCDHARRKRGRVHSMVDDRHHVGVQGVDSSWLRLASFEHVEVARRDAKVARWFDDRVALAQAVVVGNEGR